MFKYCKNCNSRFIKEGKDKELFICSMCSPVGNKANYIITNCLSCSITYKVREKRYAKGKGKYCSKDCYNSSMLKGDNKKSRKAITHSYNALHKAEKANLKHIRRAREKEAGGSFTKEDWESILKQHAYKCTHCGVFRAYTKLTVDHIIPLTVWKYWILLFNISYNWNDKENLQPLCQRCNSVKKDKMTKEDIVRTIQK